VGVFYWWPVILITLRESIILGKNSQFSGKAVLAIDAQSVANCAPNLE